MRQEETFNEIVENEKTSKVDTILTTLFNSDGCRVDGSYLLYPTEGDMVGEEHPLYFYHADDSLYFFCTFTQLANATITDEGTLVVKGHTRTDAEYQEQFTIHPLKLFTRKDWGNI